MRFHRGGHENLCEGHELQPTTFHHPCRRSAQILTWATYPSAYSMRQPTQAPFPPLTLEDSIDFARFAGPQTTEATRSRLEGREGRLQVPSLPLSMFHPELLQQFQNSDL